MEGNLVLLERCYDMTQAHILRGVLESNDIPCFLMDEHHNAVAWHLGLAIGGLRVMVREQDLDAARLLTAPENQEAPAPQEKRPPLFRKPYLPNLLMGLFGLFSGAPLRWPDKKRKD